MTCRGPSCASDQWPAAAELARDSRVVLTAESVQGDSTRLPVAWPGFSELVDAGDVLYLADGAVRLRVDGVNDTDVLTRVEVGGSVASRQGLNLPNVTVSLPAVSAEDIALIDAGLEMNLDFFAPPSCAGARTSSPCASTCAKRASRSRSSPRSRSHRPPPTERRSSTRPTRS